MEVGLLALYSTNLINSINAKNNQVYIEGYKGSAATMVEEILAGQYDFMSLKKYLQILKLDLTKKCGKMQITPAASAEINGNMIDGPGSILSLLNDPRMFTPIHTINIPCNKADGQYIEGERKYTHKETDIISRIRLNAGFQQPIIYEYPRPFLYYPIYRSSFKMRDEIKVCDQNTELIDFNDASITVIL